MKHYLGFFVLIVQILLLPFSLQQQQISPVDLAALRDIKNSLTEIQGSQFFATWDFAAPDPCSTFTGLTCYGGRVTILTLGTGLSDSPGLAGFLPSSLSSLTSLTQLILFRGLVTGPIPPQLSRLTNLRVLSLTNNRLTGPIPPSLSSLPYLHTLDLSYNLLTGTIPPGLPSHPQLRILILSSNRLSGTLPTTVSAPLLHLDLKQNFLSGPVPRFLPGSLRYLSLSQNSMWGPLNSLASLASLTYLDVSMNQFSGPIPSPLFFTPTLTSMLLQRNNLSGGVPTPPSRDGTGPTLPFDQGVTVDLSHNFLSGELSPVLAGVETLFLNNNRLRGTVPQQYVTSVMQGRMKTLYLQHNYITGFPLESGMEMPDSVSLCLSYNCMVPPVGLANCPVSAGTQLSRPASQCSGFTTGSLRG